MEMPTDIRLDYMRFVGKENKKVQEQSKKQQKELENVGDNSSSTTNPNIK